MSTYSMLLYFSWIGSMILAPCIYIGLSSVLGWRSLPVLLYGLGAAGAFAPLLFLYGDPSWGFVDQVSSAHIGALCAIGSLGILWSTVRVARRGHRAGLLCVGGFLQLGLLFLGLFLLGNTP